MTGETDRAVGVLSLAAFAVAAWGTDAGDALAAADKVCVIGQAIPNHQELLRRMQETLRIIEELRHLAEDGDG